MVTYNKTPYELLLDFQTRLQGVGNSLAADIGAIISKTDKALLNTVINSIPSGQSSVKAQMRALEKMVRQIEQIRAEGFTLAERHFMDAGPEIARHEGVLQEHTEQIDHIAPQKPARRRTRKDSGK